MNSLVVEDLSINIDRNELIKSYGFAEEIASNQNFLKESLDLIAKITESEIAYISLIDNEKQYILCQNESMLTTIDVEDSICQHTIREDSILEIIDTRVDFRTTNLPIVKDNAITFYAGSPLINNNNNKIGAICVMDTKSKKLNQTQKEILQLVGKQVVNTLDQQRGLIKLIKKINSNFKPSACADINCLRGELDHLQTEVVNQNKTVNTQKKYLEDLNKDLSVFAYVVAHDVKAPLRTIKSFAQIIEKELNINRDSSIGEYFGYINSSIINLNDLITDLLRFSEIDNDINKTGSSILLSEILGDVQNNLAASIRSKNAQIETPEKDIMVKGQKSYFISLFQNLISNGIKYQKEGSVPKINIEAVPQGNFHQISIIDNGIGIAEEYFEEIFKPFRRLHGKEKYKGSGIGLATCKKMLNKIGSDLKVTSTINKGSVFSFLLPKG